MIAQWAVFPHETEQPSQPEKSPKTDLSCLKTHSLRLKNPVWLLSFARELFPTLLYAQVSGSACRLLTSLRQDGVCVCGKCFHMRLVHQVE